MVSKKRTKATRKAPFPPPQKPSRLTPHEKHIECDQCSRSSDFMVVYEPIDRLGCLIGSLCKRCLKKEQLDGYEKGHPPPILTVPLAKVEEALAPLFAPEILARRLEGKT